MNGNLVDTNVIVNVLRNDSAAIAFLEKLDNLFIPAIVVGELYYGVNCSGRKKENAAVLDKFIEDMEVLPVDQDVAMIFADIKSELKKTGYTIPENDLWIAAIAQKYDLPIATNDKHFKNIKTISVITPEE